MTDLLVWSLMADGGLETALNEALGLDISELNVSEENFEHGTTHITIPLLYLIKQLIRLENQVIKGKKIVIEDFRNGSTQTQTFLKEFATSGKLSLQKGVLSPSLKLLSRFQRLLIGKIFSKELECQDACETLLVKYLECFMCHVTTTLNVAYETCLITPKNLLYVLQILKSDIIGE